MDWLPKNIPEQSKTSVVHGDFRVDNLIFDNNDPSKVLAVLDWELSTLGDPISDAAYGCMAHYVPHQSKMLKGLKGLDLKSMGIPTDFEYMKEYCKNVGIEPISTWNFYLSFGFFRMAAILQGVYKRSLQSKDSYSEIGEIFSKICCRSSKWRKCQRSWPSCKFVCRHELEFC